MSSSAKRRQTMAKMTRERTVKERRAKKQEKKEARKLAAADATPPDEGGERQDRGEDPAGPPPSVAYAALLAQVDVSPSDAQSLTEEELVARAVDAGVSRLTAERIVGLERGSADLGRARLHGQSRPWNARSS